MKTNSVQSKQELCKCGHDKSLHLPFHDTLECRGGVDVRTNCPCMRFVEKDSVNDNCWECNKLKGIGYFIDYAPPTDRWVCKSCYFQRVENIRKNKRDYSGKKHKSFYLKSDTT